MYVDLFIFCTHVSIFSTDEEGEEEKEGREGSPYHTIVLDCAPIAFVDSTGLAMLEQVRAVLIECVCMD